MIIIKKGNPKNSKLEHIKYKKCFAWLPKKIQSEEHTTIIFLHTYYKEYEYKEAWVRTEKCGYLEQQWVLVKEFI